MLQRSQRAARIHQYFMPFTLIVLLAEQLRHMMNVEYAGLMTTIIHITAEHVVCSVVILTGVLARLGRFNILAFG